MSSGSGTGKQVRDEAGVKNVREWKGGEEGAGDGR